VGVLIPLRSDTPVALRARVEQRKGVDWNAGNKKIHLLRLQAHVRGPLWNRGYGSGYEMPGVRWH
jgi:hypothetical protein